MKYNFDEVVNRRNTYSMKWDCAKFLKLMGIDFNWDDETLPMMVADMDFKCSPAIQAAMHRVADNGIYGYTLHMAEPRYNACIVDWYKRRYDTVIKEDWILYSNGSVSAINCAMDTFTNHGDGIIIAPPVYGHFGSMINGETCHKVVYSSMINNNGYYTMDWEDFEEKCAVPTNRMFILCSPSNPVGRVWTMDELKRMADICKKHNVLLVSDEIHSDILRKGVKHIPILKATDDHSNIILVNGINKSFNVAGLQCSNVIIPDDNLREIFRDQFGMRQPTPFSVAAVIAAYDESEEWLDALNEYLDSNIDYAIDFFHTKMPRVKVWRPEGAYMLWLDFSQYGLSKEEIHDKIYIDANVILQDGDGHDPMGGDLFQRMCVTLPRSQLTTALERIRAEFEDKKENDMRLKVGDTLSTFKFNTPFESSLDLHEQIGEKPTVLLFLRYFGCTICQLDMLKLKEAYREIEAAGGQAIVVLQSDPTALAKTLEQASPYPFKIICDPNQELYKLLDIKPAKNQLGMIGPAAIKKIAQLKNTDLQHGAYEGNELQLPAAFGIGKSGKVFYSRYGKNVGDVPSAKEIIKILQDATV